MNNIFEKTGTPSVSRSLFNLSHEKKFDFDMGQLIPILCDEAVPGDVWNISSAAVVRFNALIRPILHKVTMRTYYFFVPYRIIDEDFVEFITKGENGTTVIAPPKWIRRTPTADLSIDSDDGRYSLWDYLGFPLIENGYPALINDDTVPLDYPRRAYYLIWNEYFRDQNLQNEFDYLSPFGANETWFNTNYGVPNISANSFVLGKILNRNWTKDYFTAALPFQQRGTAPMIPLAGGAPFSFTEAWDAGSLTATNAGTLVTHSMTYSGAPSPTNVDWYTPLAEANAVPAFDRLFNDAFTPINVGISITDLRLTIQLQTWMENNARGGVRYTEFLKNHGFGAYPRDERLSRPEYIGGSINDVIISEVLQTSETDTSPQGTLAGHGIAVNSSFQGKYRVEEFGLIMGLMCVVPKAAYQNGMNRQWMRRTALDFYFREFANLSEQEVYNYEINLKDNVTVGSTYDNFGVFGYQGKYNEMRYKSDLVCGDLRNLQAFWHLGRNFNPDPTEDFLLNSSFIVCVPRKDIFVLEDTTTAMVCSFGNILKVLRPMPYIPDPAGLLR